MRKTVITTLLASAMMLAAGPADAEKKVLLKVGSWFPSALPGLGTSLPWVAKQINAVGGNLTMKFYEPGKLIPPKEMLEAVSKGQIDGGHTTPGYNTGKVGEKGAIFSSVPFGPDASEYLAWIYYGGGRELAQKAYDDAGFNVENIPCGIIAPETSGWFTKEINTPADLKGLRMRFFGLGARVMEKLGVSTSQLPGGEIVPALQKGAIDATEYSMPAMDVRLGINKILKYNYFPGWHQASTLFYLIVNKDTWNKEMSAGQRALVELACTAVMADGLAMGEAAQAPVMRANAKAGTQNKYWSPEMLNTFRETWDEVREELIKEDPGFKEVWDDLEAFRADYKVWNEWAYMPRPGTKRVAK
ncbi:MAG: TRAP transporter substrate-binding protein [Nitrospinaceae bacterium]|jgi:TRAP-type mannitol/chloroaromatic compound transport system substrate-binding protein|nr:TRAP transporter substrate-binding protein [Nitrospinaceae bacterium]